MKKYTEKGKQERQSNHSLAIQQSQGPLVSSFSMTIHNILSHVLGGVLQVLKPLPGGRSQPHGAHKLVDPRRLVTEG